MYRTMRLALLNYTKVSSKRFHHADILSVSFCKIPERQQLHTHYLLLKKSYDMTIPYAVLTTKRFAFDKFIYTMTYSGLTTSRFAFDEFIYTMPYSVLTTTRLVFKES